MSSFIRPLFRTLALSVTLLMALPTAAEAAEAGFIKTLRGQVQILRPSGLIEAKLGEVIHGGDHVRVVGDGSVGISFRDETLISLGANSNLVIDKFQFDPTTRDGQVETSILRGTLRYVTGLIGRANPRAIKVFTPTATVGIRGTDFIVEVPDE